MKVWVLIVLLFSVFTGLSAQSIEDQLKELNVFKEKVVFEWIEREKLDLTAPFVTIDWMRKPQTFKNIDSEKVLRIERLKDDLARHLYEEDAENGVYRLVVDETTNKDAFFKLVTNPPFHSSCRSVEGKQNKESCTKEFLDSKLIKHIEKQEKFVLEIAIDRQGTIVELNIREGESNPPLEKLFESWKNKEFEWYPGLQRKYFVNTYHYYKYKR